MGTPTTPPTDWNKKFFQRLLEIDQTALAQMYYDLRLELTNPPEGWHNFGTHLDRVPGSGLLETWGTGDDGMPIWERPIP